MKRSSFLSIAAAFAIAGTAYSAPSKPDILFVLVDSVRPSHMGCYGYPRGTTPFLDRFAREEAVRFETVVAGGSWTQPAVMSLFTSVEPGVHLRVRPDAPHAVGLATLAGALREVREEVGVALDPARGKVVFTKVRGKIDGRRFNDILDIWLFAWDGPIALENATTDEVAQAGWMTRAEIEARFAGGDMVETLGYFLPEAQSFS